MTARFQIQWLDVPDFKDWLEEVPSDINKAKCKICHVTFSLSNMGRRAVKSHANGKEHKNRMKAFFQSSSIKCFTVPGDDSSSTSAVSASNAENTPLPEDTSHSTVTMPRGLTSFLQNESVLKAEILWCLHSVEVHKSMRMAEKDVSMFKVLFPDSEVAQKIKLKRSKMAYSVLYGIAPYFKTELLDNLSKSEHLTVGFDESLNKITQRTQMDVGVRFWCTEKDQVSSRYLTSTFLGSSTADKIRDSFKTALSDIKLKNVIQISMDGPNVNLKFYKDLKSELECNEDFPVLLNIGTCGLHTLHGAFKTGIQATSWSLISFFRSLYNLFKDVPARRALYTEYTNSNMFPKKFCSVRWLQNADVAQRAIDMLPHIRNFVICVQKDKKQALINCSSFKIVSNSVKDNLFEAKLAFFKSVSNEVEPFLEEYQTDIPMIPFLHSSLTSIIKSIMSRYVKDDVLDGTDFLHQIDLSDQKNLKSAYDIDLGYGTRKALRKRKNNINSDKEILELRKQCASCLKAVCLKLMERSPLIYPLTKAVTCFDPAVAKNQTLSKTRIKSLLTILLDSKIISVDVADRAEKEYLKICRDSDAVEEMNLFNRQTCRVDIFWRNIFNKFGNCDSVRSVMKIVMIISHGNATIERGFSVNGECLIENLKEDTLIAQRLVYDKIKSSELDVSSFKISKELLQSYKNARSSLTEAVKRKENEILEKDAEEIKKKKIKLATKELNDKIDKIKQNARNEVDALMEEIKALNG